MNPTQPDESSEEPSPNPQQQNPTYNLDDELAKGGCHYCAALFIPDRPMWDPGTGLEETRTPGISEHSGTVTFVERGDRFFAVTAWHCVEALRKLSGPGYFMTRTNANLVISDRWHHCFVAGEGDVDVAIQEIDVRHIDTIGKRAFKTTHALAECGRIPTHGAAIGFPSCLRRADRDSNGARLIMPCTMTIATCVSEAPSRVLRFHSIVDEASTANISDLGGMSGGPVFSSDGERHFLTGIASEAQRTYCEVGGHHRLSFVATRATVERFEQWIHQLDSSGT